MSALERRYRYLSFSRVLQACRVRCYLEIVNIAKFRGVSLRDGAYMRAIVPNRRSTGERS